MAYQLRNAVGSNQNHSKSETTRVATRNAVDRIARELYSSNLITTALGAEHRAMAFNIYPARFWFCFCQISLYLSVFFEWNGNTMSL